MLQRFRFYEVFQKNADGSLTPKRIINIGGVIIGPGVSFGAGVSFGGVDIFQNQMYDIAAEEVNGLLVIKGFYTK